MPIGRWFFKVFQQGDLISTLLIIVPLHDVSLASANWHQHYFTSPCNEQTNNKTYILHSPIMSSCLLPTVDTNIHLLGHIHSTPTHHLQSSRSLSPKVAWKPIFSVVKNKKKRQPGDRRCPLETLLQRVESMHFLLQKTRQGTTLLRYSYTSSCVGIA